MLFVVESNDPVPFIFMVEAETHNDAAQVANAFLLSKGLIDVNFSTITLAELTAEVVREAQDILTSH